MKYWQLIMYFCAIFLFITGKIENLFSFRSHTIVSYNWRRMLNREKGFSLKAVLLTRLDYYHWDLKKEEENITWCQMNATTPKQQESWSESLLKKFWTHILIVDEYMTVTIMNYVLIRLFVQSQIDVRIWKSSSSFVPSIKIGTR